MFAKFQIAKQIKFFTANYELSYSHCLASCYRRLPAGHDKSKGFIAEIYCEVAINLILNFEFGLFTSGNACKNWIHGNLENSFDTIFDETMGHFGLNFLLDI